MDYIGWVEEISMPAAIGLVDDDRSAAVAFHVRTPARVDAVALHQLPAKLRCIETRLPRHYVQSTPADKGQATRDGPASYCGKAQIFMAS